jgi:hypothetical protein
MDHAKVSELVRAEVSLITDADLKARIERLLIHPRAEARGWDYGAPGQEFICWIVLEHHTSNTGIAYCEQGFGPKCPWGLLFLKGRYTSMGMDSAWFFHLQDAFLDSFAGDETAA